MERLVKIQFDEEDLLEILVENFNLDLTKSKLTVVKTEKDRPWDVEYFKFTLEGKPKNQESESKQGLVR